MPATVNFSYRARAAFRARRSGTGIGAALVRSTANEREHVWDCIVADGRECTTSVSPARILVPDVSVAYIECGTERFAGTLTAQNRIYNLLNADPFHVHATGT